MAVSASSGLTFKLHPHVFVNISDDHTRVKAQTHHSAAAEGVSPASPLPASSAPSSASSAAAPSRSSTALSFYTILSPRHSIVPSSRRNMKGSHWQLKRPDHSAILVSLACGSLSGIASSITGFVSSYLRFFPYIKKNYNYGMIIFLLTFNLISISSFRVENILQMARARLYTICIGCCLFMCLLILPNWSGEDLHNSTIRKLEALAKSVGACVDDYFQDEEIRAIEKSSRYAIYKGYKSVLDSKSTDGSLALYASWEPRHSRHCYPWQQYVKLGTVLRHFAYTAESLHGCLECQIQRKD